MLVGSESQMGSVLQFLNILHAILSHLEPASGFPRNLTQEDPNSYFLCVLRPVWSRHWASVHSPTIHLRYPNQEDTPKGPLMLDHLITSTSTNWCSDTQYAWFGRPKKKKRPSFFSYLFLWFKAGGVLCREELWFKPFRCDLPFERGL